MQVILDTEDKKIVSESGSYSTNGTYTDTTTLLNMGNHATHRFRGAFDRHPDIWKVTELSMIDTRDGQSKEIKAEFLYRAMEFAGDTYKPLRTMIKTDNPEQTSEEKRIVFYDRNGTIDQDQVVISPLDKGSIFDHNSVAYTLNKATGSYVSESGEIYHGQISNDGILDKVNLLVEQSEALFKSIDKTL